MEALYEMFCNNVDYLLDAGYDPISEEVMGECDRAACAYCKLMQEKGEN